MNNNRLLKLLSKYQDNTCSGDELIELEQWYQQLNSGNPSIEEKNAGAFTEEMRMQFRKRLAEDVPVVPLYRRLYFRFSVAAAVIILLSAGVYFKFFNRVQKKDFATTNTESISDKASPNLAKATLTLAGGQTVLLDSINNGKLVSQGGVDVVKAADGSIVYRGVSTEMVYNVLFNPRGSKTVSITTGDGTRVWLNSESSIRYPVAFIGSERRVEITGEAYFEVAKDPSKKFIVTGNGVQTEVLGTHFNVNTYADESSVKVTLLEGSVRVFKGAERGLLKPGQQARVSTTVKVISGIDTDGVMAWKNGFFHFNNTTVKELLNQVSRWYDVEIVYKKDVPQREFGGEISRAANLSEILKILNEIKVDCRLEGNKLIVE